MDFCASFEVSQSTGLKYQSIWNRGSINISSWIPGIAGTPPFAHHNGDLMVSHFQNELHLSSVANFKLRTTTALFLSSGVEIKRSPLMTCFFESANCFFMTRQTGLLKFYYSVCLYNMIRKCKHSPGIIIWVKFFAQLGAKRSAPNCPIFTCEKVLIFCLCFNSLSFIAFTHHYRARRIKGTRKYLWSYTLSSKGNNIFE